MRCQSCLETRLWSDPDRLHGICYFPMFPGCWLSISNDGNFLQCLWDQSIVAQVTSLFGTSISPLRRCLWPGITSAGQRMIEGCPMSSGPLQFWYRLQCLSFQGIPSCSKFRISDERGSIVEHVELIFCWSHRHAQNKVIDLAIRTDVVAAFLKRYNLDLVCRAHQVVEDGQTLHACCPRNGWSIGPWRDALQIHDLPISFWIKNHRKLLLPLNMIPLYSFQ